MYPNKGNSGDTLMNMKKVIKVVLGLIFIFSAVMKIIGMDNFELYIYSYHFFSLNFTFLVARAAIIIELVLGLLLVLDYFHKLTWWGCVTMLAGYTFFLLYAQLIGRTDSCHCFGDILQFNPWQSIIKNAVLIMLFLFVYNVRDTKFRYQWLAFIGIVITVSAAVFVISPPDNYTSNYKSHELLHQDLFQDALHRPPLDSLPLCEGRKVVCLFSSACKYCQMTARKLSIMQQIHSFPGDDIYYVFMGNKEGVDKFYAESESLRYHDVIYDDVIGLLKINDGIFPVVILMEEGRIVQEYDFRNMNEGQIEAFFKQNEATP